MIEKAWLESINDSYFCIFPHSLLKHAQMYKTHFLYYSFRSMEFISLNTISSLQLE